MKLTTMKIALLKEFFPGFLRTRHFARHFRRLAMLDSVSDASVSREVPPTLAQTLTGGASTALGFLQTLLGHLTRLILIVLGHVPSPSIKVS